MKSEVYVQFYLDQVHYTAFRRYKVTAITDKVSDLRQRITCVILCLNL
jgi:hypothetical protein